MTGDFLTLMGATQFRALWEHAADAMAVSDAAGVVLAANERYYELYGYPAEEVVGHSFAIIFPPQQRAAAEAQYRAVFEGRLRVQAYEAVVRRADGTERVVESRIEFIEADGEPPLMLSIIRDITERKRAEEALRASEAHNRALLARERLAHSHASAALALLDTLVASAPLGIAFVDTEFRYLRVNGALAAMNGVPAEDHIGRRASELFPEYFPLWERHWRSVLATGEPVINLEIGGPGQGDQGYVLVNYYPVRTTNGEIFGIGILVQSITERKRADMAKALLASTTAVLNAALDLPGTLQEVVRLPIPALADYCAVHLVGDGPEPSAVAAAHRDPSQEAALEALLWARPSSEALVSAIDQVLSTGVLLLRQGDVGAPPPAPGAGNATAPHALIVAPLVARGRRLGAIALAQTAPGSAFRPDDLLLAEELARRTALAIDNSQLYAAEQRARAATERTAVRITRIQLITAALSQAVTAQQVAQVVIGQGVAAAGGCAGFLALLAQPDPRMEVAASAGQPEELAGNTRRIAAGAVTPAADAARTQAPVWLGSPEERRARYPSFAEAHVGSQRTAWAALPLLVSRQVVGVIGVDFEVPDALGGEQRDLLLTLANLCAQAIERARLYEEERRMRVLAERSATWFAQLQSITARFSEALTSQQVVAAAVEEGRRSLVASAGLFAAVRHAGERPEVIYRSDVAESDLAGWALVEQELAGPLAAAADGGRTVVLEGQPAGAPAGALVAVPLLDRGQPIGVLGYRFAEPRTFGMDERAFVEALGQQCAQALERARLYEAAQEARTAAEAAVQVRNQFLSIASHELKTPLTSLLGNAQLLLRRAERDALFAPREQRSVQVIADQAGRLERMVSALLDISRLQTGQMAIVTAPLDVVALVQRVADEIRPMLTRHTIELARAPEALPVLGDELRLEQVVYNLLQNAVKYSPEGGPVQVRVERRGQSAQLSVVDRGIGIPPDALPHLFQRFYRASNSEALRISGMGVGLYVVREIVELHGGAVEVESAEGAGSTFSVRLPLAGA